MQIKCQDCGHEKGKFLTNFLGEQVVTCEYCGVLHIVGQHLKDINTLDAEFKEIMEKNKPYYKVAAILSGIVAILWAFLFIVLRLEI